MKKLKYYYFIISFIFLGSIQSFSQRKTNTDTNSSKLISAAKEIMQSANTCALISIDNKGIPRVRTMDPFPPEDGLIVWFGTNSYSRKVKQIQENPKVTLYYTDNDNTGYVMIHGNASIINNTHDKEKHWKEKWKDFYPNFPDDYLLIKVIPEWMEIVSETRNILGDDKTWEPQKVTFKY